MRVQTTRHGDELAALEAENAKLREQLGAAERERDDYKQPTKYAGNGMLGHIDDLITKLEAAEHKCKMLEQVVEISKGRVSELETNLKQAQQNEAMDCGHSLKFRTLIDLCGSHPSYIDKDKRCPNCQWKCSECERIVTLEEQLAQEANADVEVQEILSQYAKDIAKMEEQLRAAERLAEITKDIEDDIEHWRSHFEAAQANWDFTLAQVKETEIEVGGHKLYIKSLQTSIEQMEEQLRAADRLASLLSAPGIIHHWRSEFADAANSYLALRSAKNDDLA